MAVCVWRRERFYALGYPLICHKDTEARRTASCLMTLVLTRLRFSLCLWGNFVVGRYFGSFARRCLALSAASEEGYLAMTSSRVLRAEATSLRAA